MHIKCTYVLEVEAHVLLLALAALHSHVHGRLVDARARGQLAEGLQVARLRCNSVGG